MAAPERDRTTVRRALRAGLVVTVVAGVPLVVAALLAGAGLVGLAVVAGLAAGVLATAGWLLLAGLLDVWAGDLPGARRLAVTAVFTVLALLSPYVVLVAAAAR